MARIKLIVTGDMEKQALHVSLSQVFSIQDGEPVIWDTPRKVQCATSHRLTEAREPSKLMVELVKAMFSEVGIGKTGHPADLVVVIDDLELDNLEQEHVVAAHFRAAVESVLSTYNMAAQDRYRALLRDKCSFHLMKPMVEAYLFGDEQALRIAGVPDTAILRLVHATDVEAFETNDPAWLPTCQTENIVRRERKPWWRHECHPKHYLEHLAKRGQEDYEYEETRHGRNALMTLAWQRVPKLASDAPILRALFQDLADWFNLPNPLGNGDQDARFYPERTVRRDRLLLRNM